MSREPYHVLSSNSISRMRFSSTQGVSRSSDQLLVGHREPRHAVVRRRLHGAPARRAEEVVGQDEHTSDTARGIGCAFGVCFRGDFGFGVGGRGVLVRRTASEVAVVRGSCLSPTRSLPPIYVYGAKKVLCSIFPKTSDSLYALVSPTAKKIGGCPGIEPGRAIIRTTPCGHSRMFLLI
jgi:hypothetical protein